MIRINFIAVIFFSSILFAQPEKPSDLEVLQQMMNLTSDDFSVQVSAAEWLGELRDISVVPAFLDAMYLVDFHSDLGWILKDVTGQKFYRDWPRWVEWLGNQEFQPHPAYRHYKQRIFQQIDPAFGVFLNPGFESKIRWDEIVWGRVKKDGIPSLFNPVLLPADSATYLRDNDPVFGVEVNGESHAYPLRILDYHEVLNTVIGGRSLTVAYCALCGSAIPYFTEVDGQTYTFGTSGLLYRSNKLMYDRETNSLWSSIYGTPVVGKLVKQDIELESTHLTRTTWKQWRSNNPETLVLSKETGYDRNYDSDSPLEPYFKSKNPMFPIAKQNDNIDLKEWVFGLGVGSINIAYPLKRLEKQSVVNETVGEKSYVIVLVDKKALSVYAFERGSRQFKADKDRSTLIDEKGKLWHISESGLVSGDEHLDRLDGHLAYWFAWYAFYPNTKIWQPETSK